MERQNTLQSHYDAPNHVLVFKGDLTLPSYEALSTFLAQITLAHKILLDFTEVRSMDTAGAEAIAGFEKRCQVQKTPYKRQGLNPASKAMLSLLEGLPDEKLPKTKPRSSVVTGLDNVGTKTINFFQDMYDLLCFMGMFIVNFFESFRSFFTVMLPNTFLYMRKAGLRALPIVMTTSFVVGLVLSYEGIVQLAKFGAETSVITLISFSVLREAGVLITAIVIAGRSGSSFAAEIGTMKVNEEIDAMRIMGLNPVHVLVVPRVLALIIFLPVLTLAADFCGLLGGAIVCMYELDIGIMYFFRQVHDVVSTGTFLIGIVKAPIFGMMIGLIGCMEGLKVQGNAESVGARTTVSVVKAIFYVIIFNSIFSVLASYLRIGV